MTYRLLRKPGWKELQGFVVAILLVVPLFLLGLAIRYHVLAGLLANASERWDTARMVSLLRQGAPIDAPVVEGKETLLTRSVLRNDTAMVQLLLRLGANPNHRDFGETALHHAAQWGMLESARLLLTYGAEVDAVDGAGDTPLIEAAANLPTKLTADVWVHGGDTEEITSLLLAWGADPTHRNRAGRTALDVARTSGDQAFAYLFFEAERTWAVSRRGRGIRSRLDRPGSERAEQK